MTYLQLYFDFFCEEKEQSRLRRIEADKKAEKYKNRNKNIYDFCKANLYRDWETDRKSVV